MSKYSFIEAELNIPGKQCFCVDINTSNTPFTYASQINSTPSTVGGQQPPPEPFVLTAPTSSIVPPLVSHSPDFVDNNNLFSVDTTYLLSPDSKGMSSPSGLQPSAGGTNGDREKQIIQTVNSLLASAANDITNDQSNANTMNNYKDDDIDDTNLDDLNKIANRGTKKYKSKSKSLNFLQEGFEQDKCNNTCSIKKSYKKNKSLLNSDNMIVILLLIVIAYLFYNKK